MSDAAEVPKKQYIKISTTVLLKMTKPLPFNIYIQRAPGKFTKIIEKGNRVDKERLAKYQSEKNVMFLYIHFDDQEAYSFQVEGMIDQVLDKPTDHELDDIRGILEEMNNIALDEVTKKTELSAKSIRWAQKSIIGCTQMMENDFKGLCKIVRMFSSRPYQAKHAFMTSIFAMLLAKALEYESEKTLRNIGLGGMLHDIGLNRLDPKLSEHGDLTPEEYKEKKKHPQLGVEIVQTLSGIPSEVRQIILQHHEQPNGHGYPNGLYDREIFPLAKIVAIADGFTTLITDSPGKDTEHDAIAAYKMMEEDVGKYDKKMMKAFHKVILPGVEKAKVPRYNN